MKVFFWTAAAVVAGIFLYTMLTRKRGAMFSGRQPASGTTYKDNTGATIFAGPDVDPYTGAHNAPDDRIGTVQFPAQGN
jgi:hypothetical protein